jgi:hypothetical protein
MGLEYLVDLVGVPDVCLHERQMTLSLKPFQVSIPSRARKIIDKNNLITSAQVSARSVAANKTRTPSHYYFHSVSPKVAVC